jgi:histone acetyltransferase MYST1
MDERTVQEHEALTKVKTISRVQFSLNFKVKAWYFSPFPQELQNLDTLYVCENCLSFYPEEFSLKHHLEHTEKLNLNSLEKESVILTPPGNEVYRD